MQEYAIDKGIRGRVTIILFTISILLTVLIRQSGIGDKLMTGFVYILKLGKINETVDILGFVPDILGVPFWYGVMWWLLITMPGNVRFSRNFILYLTFPVCGREN